jgi:hypothetical protein
MDWRKSSYSFSNGNCLEWRWQKSSHSGACVEARQDGAVQVRDSKDPDGPVLMFPGSTWGRFVAALKKA